MQGGSSDRPRTSDYRHRSAAPDATEDFLFHLYRGSELLQDNRVHEAKEELEQALRLQPRDAKGQDLLAVVYFRLGLYPRAIEIYEELVQEFPRDASLTQNLSLCYLKTGQPDKARALLEHLVMTQPNHLRAWSYLGLVHERLGDYEKARTAFERGQQPGMARRMEDLLAGGIPPRSLSVAPPGSPPGSASAPPPPAADTPKAPPEAFHELEREVTLIGIPSVAARPSAIPPPPPPPSEQPVEAPRSQPPSVAPASGTGRASLAHEDERLPTLSELGRTSLMAFPREATLAAHSAGLVLVRVAPTFAVRPIHIQLLSGDMRGFQSKPLARRMRNRSLDEPLGGAEAPLVSLSGTGCVALGPRKDEDLIAFRMEGDFLFLREEVLVGFDETLAYENGRLAAFEGEAVALVQLRGHGGVVLRTRGAIASVEVRAEHTAVLARDCVLGWAGRLLPRELAPDEAPGGTPGLISFAGDGTVFAGTARRAVPS